MTQTTSANPAREAFERGHVAQKAGRTSEALAAYRDAVHHEPQLAPAHYNLAQIYRTQGQPAPAAAHFAEAARLRPGAPDVWLNLGLCQDQLGELDQAIASYRHALELSPGMAEAHFNLGNVQKRQGDLLAALRSFGEAFRLAPGAPEVSLNFGNTLRELSRPDEAVAALDRALALRPDWTEAHWNRALALLAAGRLTEGWEEYEWRWRFLGLDPRRGFSWPLWNGEPLEGRHILVWREQGLGDELMFATLIPDLVEQGARVTLAVDPRLVTLLGRAFPSVHVLADRNAGTRVGERYDFHAPLGGLPRFLRMGAAEFPARWSLGTPARLQLGAWAERLGGLPLGLKVGISWRSGLRSADRVRFYADLAEWRPLFAVPGITWVNLQYDDCDDELQEIERSGGVRIHRWPGVDLRDDLESVAALVWHLDLVITAPTAVSSIAGFIGTETWQVDLGSDWTRHGEQRSPWLPAVRVFSRSASGGTWRGLFDGVAAELASRVAPPTQVNSSRTVTG